MEISLEIRGKVSTLPRPSPPPKKKTYLGLIQFLGRALLGVNCAKP